MQDTRTEISRQRWFVVKNSGGSTIPPWACVYPSSVEDDGTVLVEQHSNDSAKLWCFNGPREILSNHYGNCTVSFPCYALYDSSLGGTPSNGDMWGTVANSYRLGAQGRRGFIIVGGDVTVASYKRVLVVPEICVP